MEESGVWKRGTSTILDYLRARHRATPMIGLAPLAAQVVPCLFELTERWGSGGTAGEVAVGDLLRQVLVDDPRAPLRLTYVTSQLHVATVVSPTFYRQRAYEARDQLIVHIEAPATGARQAWLHAEGESRTLVSAARREAGGPRVGALRAAPDDPARAG
jgi:hypothetical protein